MKSSTHGDGGLSCRPIPSSRGWLQPPALGVAVGGLVAAVAIAGVLLGEEGLLALWEA